jgi:hypothetical protein
MTWAVYDNTTGKLVEGDFKSLGAASRAYWIFCAHEKKNGRVPNYRIEPPALLIPAEELNLPDWVHEALKPHPE